MSRRYLPFHYVARHGYSIERLKRDMALEESRDHLVDFLAFEAASFVYGFLLASGNAVSAEDRRLRMELQNVILATLARHGIDRASFVVKPEIEADAPLTRRSG